MLNKVRFCHNISFWPHLIHFWAVSLKNRLKMCAFSRGITWETGPNWSGCVVWKHATATASLVLNSLVQFSLRSFFSPMDQTFKHYGRWLHWQRRVDGWRDTWPKRCQRCLLVHWSLQDSIWSAGVCQSLQDSTRLWLGFGIEFRVQVWVRVWVKVQVRLGLG